MLTQLRFRSRETSTFFFLASPLMFHLSNFVFVWDTSGVQVSSLFSSKWWNESHIYLLFMKFFNFEFKMWGFAAAVVLQAGYAQNCYHIVPKKNWKKQLWTAFITYTMIILFASYVHAFEVLWRNLRNTLIIINFFK